MNKLEQMEVAKELIDAMNASLQASNFDELHDSPVVIFIRRFRNKLIDLGMSENLAYRLSVNAEVEIHPTTDPDVVIYLADEFALLVSSVAEKIKDHDILESLARNLKMQFEW